MHLRSTPGVLTAFLAVFLAVAPPPANAQEETDTAAEPADTTEDRGRSPALTHVHHVSVTFRGTPGDMGLLPTAVAEGEIALRHAELAAGDPADLAAMQRHAGHVLHALDPSAVEDGGPGRGYGAIHAAERTAHYIGLAAASDGASEAVRTHAEHIETAARSAVDAGTAAVELAGEILATDDAAVAAELLEELVERADAMLNGLDADGDGRIGWQEGEGGLAQAAQHLQLLRRAEGLSEG